MIRPVLLVLALLYCRALSAAGAGCAAGVAAGSFQLLVEPASGGEGIAIRRLNVLGSGCRLNYRPLELPADLDRDAKVTLVLIPSGSGSGAQATVLPPKPAAAASSWEAPFRTGILALIYGPQGLDEKRITSLVTRDQELISQLADYAGQTGELEETIEALTRLESEENFEDSEEAAARITPAEQALFALVRALNPAAAGYNPLGAGRAIGSTRLAGRAAGGFFENAGGVVPGGGILPSVKGWLFPDTEFRSVYAQSTEPDGFILCAQRQQGRTRTRVAFVWAYRLRDAGPPSISMARPTRAPLGLTWPVAVRMKQRSEWQLVDRVREWTLVAQPGGERAPVKVKLLLHTRELQLDLRQQPGRPGAYRLSGKWDWTPIDVAGDLHLDLLDDLQGARVTEASQARVSEDSGVVGVELEGADFQFVEKVTLARAGARAQKPVELDVSPALEDRSGPQNTLLVDVDTRVLKAGQYLLAFSQAGRVRHETPLTVFGALPKLANLPLRVSAGDGEQRILLRGSSLERIERIESDRADIRLEPARADGQERQAIVRLRREARSGDRAPLAFVVGGAPLRFAAALQVAGPRPRIAGAKSSLPELGIALREGELPAGSFAGFSIRVESVEGQPTVHLQCAENERIAEARTLRPETGRDGGLFLSFDPGSVGRNGCTVTAVVETEAGRSEPFALGRVVRVPRIESFVMTGDRAGEGYAATVRGQDLDAIEKTGWDVARGLPVEGLPAPVAGEGAKQVLRIVMPWPSPAPRSPLHVWLRGDTQGRATTARY